MWHPVLYGEIEEMIHAAEAQMEPAVRAFWGRIGVVPQKWQLPPWGDEGGGFWVVAVVGHECVYYNDIEDGFNTSEYKTAGRIEEYGCDQTDLLTFINAYHADFTAAVTAAA